MSINCAGHAHRARTVTSARGQEGKKKLQKKWRGTRNKKTTKKMAGGAGGGARLSITSEHHGKKKPQNKMAGRGRGRGVNHAWRPRPLLLPVTSARGRAWREKKRQKKTKWRAWAGPGCPSPAAAPPTLDVSARRGRNNKKNDKQHGGRAWRAAPANHSAGPRP